MGLIMPSFQRSEIAAVKSNTRKLFHRSQILQWVFGEINLFQMLQGTYCCGEDKTLYLLLLHRDCPSREGTTGTWWKEVYDHIKTREKNIQQ